MWRSNFLFLVVIYVVRANHCPRDWTNVDNFCMAFMEQPETWALASSYCVAQGGHLASLQTELKNRLTIDFLRSNNVRGPVWLSGTDALKEGHWMWTPSDQLMTFTNWGSTHGDNDNNEDCLVIDMKSSQWRDRDCYTEKYSYLCERPTFISEPIPVFG